MGMLQYLRIFSILSALSVGLWLPIHLIEYHLPFAVDLFFDLLISAASIVNVCLYFKETGASPKVFREWRRPGLLADLLCVLPLSLIGPIWIPSSAKALLFVNFLTVRHVRRIKAFLDGFHNLQPVVYRLVPIGVAMPLLVHLVACGWIALGSGTAGTDPDHALEYIKAIYWAFTTLTTVGYGDIAAKTPAQMLFASFVQVTGVGVFGFVLSNVASLLSRMDAAREHHMDNVDKIETYMRSHRIPVELRSKIRTYYHYLWTNHRGYRDNALLHDLPKKMQSELFFHINRSIVEKVPIFSGASPELIEDLMNELKPKIFVPGEKIFKVDEPGSALYFIHSGEVDILSRDNDVLARLKDGAFFGEAALISERPRNATARAATFCDIYTLPKDAFDRVVAIYPEFAGHMQQAMKDRQAPGRAA